MFIDFFQPKLASLFLRFLHMQKILGMKKKDIMLWYLKLEEAAKFDFCLQGFFRLLK